MTTITIEVSNELSEQLFHEKARLPELLSLSLLQPPLSAQTYRYVLNFLASEPTPEQIAAFGPTPEMAERVRTLLAKERTNQLTPTEQAELDDYEDIEHLVVMAKAGALPYLNGAQ